MLAVTWNDQWMREWSVAGELNNNNNNLVEEEIKEMYQETFEKKIKNS